MRIDERIAERRQQVREERRRWRLRRTLTVAVLLAVGVATVLVERSSLVALEEVRVVGTDRLTVDEVLAAADLELGTSTLRLRLGRAATRVEALPAVAEATARRVDPLTVEIEVVEREPVLVVEAGATVLVDQAGVVLASGEQEGLPVVVVRDETPEPGDHVDDHPALANAYAAWRQLSGPVRAEVAVLRADGPDELDLVLASGVEVRFGRAERVDEKVRALGAVLEDVRATGTDVAVVDVRAPAAPVVVGP